jgi:cytoskeletal protein RodZ
MPTSSDSLGSYLRAEREQRRVSLQEISAATKIQVKFLRALEEDAYDQLPPAPLYVVGFLRAYAQCLSLDPEELVTAYSQHYHVQARRGNVYRRRPRSDVGSVLDS